MFDLIIKKLKDYIFKEYHSAKFCLSIFDTCIKTPIPKLTNSLLGYSMTN